MKLVGTGDWNLELLKELCDEETVNAITSIQVLNGFGNDKLISKGSTGSNFKSKIAI